MAECLYLASKAVGRGSPPEPTKELVEEATQSVAEVEPKTPAEPEPEVPNVQSEEKAVKRKLVLKDDPRSKRQKPSRVSKRCLGRGMTRKAGASTASEAVEISSEDEGVTPTKTEEEPISAANPEEAHEEAEVMPPTPTAQEETPAEEEPLTSAEEKPDHKTEEERYQSERKRKGNAPVQKKQTNKKTRIANTRVVIREPPREETSDRDYSSREESDSEDDVSLEEEDIQERKLPENHYELVHPPV